MGYSSRDLFPDSTGITASSEPSGLQTRDTDVLGDLARRAASQGHAGERAGARRRREESLSTRIASSPLEEMDRMSALGMPSGRDSRLSVLTE